MDVTLKSRPGWMAAGALTCLIALAVAVRLCGAGPARAQSPSPEPPHADSSAPTRPPTGTALPNLAPTPGSEPPLAQEAVPVRADVPAPPVPGSAPPGAAPPAPVPPPPGSEERPILIPAGASPAAPPPPPANLPPQANGTTPSPAPLPVPAPPSVLPNTPDAPPPPGTTSPTPPPVTPVAAVLYRVPTAGMTVKMLARKVLGSVERWPEICKLNPAVNADTVFAAGATVSLPPDAATEPADVTPLPALRSRPAPRPKAVLPLTGTYPARVDDHGDLILPPAVVEQLGHVDTVLMSPGSDRCLWLTNQAHLDRLGQKLDRSPARESDIQSFRRLYYAQTVKSAVTEGKANVNARLAAFAGISRDVVLVGVDDHFEVWDAARWHKYTQAKKARPTAE